ncbi:SAM-dependent methyltransferase, partial [Streptomyces sp. NPDC127079]|uniref:SAM-dependent methyltransferase n=1 Tax=Streptomyces sp. NPDC127079 TaxID=3347132 RepID=UPI00365AE884
MSNLDELSTSPRTAPEPQDEVKIVGQYYDDKTARLVRKYGPGPRIHYHVGHYPSSRTPLDVHDATPDAIRRSIRLHQEGLLRYAAKIWGAEHRLSGRILDVGCGLGGGSLFWAQEYGADVTAVTNAPEHAPLVEGFARECGVEGRVRALVCDAMHLPADDGPYDAAVAIESSGYFDRARWFERLARALRPGGSVCIEEVFITRPHGADVWAEYFYTKPATVRDYAESSHAAGFDFLYVVDATSETAPFWEESTPWSHGVFDNGIAHCGCVSRAV